MTTLPIRVYYVTSAEDSTVRIGMDVRHGDGLVRWFDSVKERSMGYAKIVDEDPNHFVFERREKEGGGTYTFVPMTLAFYNAHVKQHILIPQEFFDEEAMLVAFEKTRENAW